MYLRLSLITLLSVFILSSCSFDVCSSKRMYVNSYDQFMKKIEKNQEDYSEKDWEELDAKFERFSEECYEKFEDDLSKKEKNQIMKHNLKYVVVRVKSELPFDLSEDNQQKVDDFLDGLELDGDNIKINGKKLKEIWEDVDKTKFKEAADEFGKGFEKLEKAFEEIGKELEEIFEESSSEKKSS